DPITAGVLLEVRAGAVRFRVIEPLPAGTSASVEIPREASSVESLRDTLVGLLTREGLYRKEARAMVKTWGSAWFHDEGTRVLYALPGGWTARALPLKVTPKPDSLVRVMVGRHDVLTPEREHEIDGLVRQLHGSPAEKAAASQALAKLGRFAPP